MSTPTLCAKRLDIIEKRQELMLQALRGEWKGKPEGEFEKAWDAVADERIELDRNGASD
jgi:hypothetical protein